MRPIKCLLGSHRWHNRATEGGERYRMCDRCGKIYESRPFGEGVNPGPML